MKDQGEKSLMSSLSDRLSENPAYMAYTLRRYCEVEGVSSADLPARLGLSELLVNRLALCKRPDRQSGTFLSQVDDIADFVLLDSLELLKLIRLVDSLEQAQHSFETDVSPVGVSLIPEILFSAALDRMPDDEVMSDEIRGENQADGDVD